MMACLTLALIFSAQPKVAQSPPTALAKVQATYQKSSDFEADFKQVYIDKVRHKRREETGHLWAKLDGRVRWTYLQPIRKDFIFDGQVAHFYEPENAQVTIFERFEDSPLWNAVRFLWGQGDILKTFDAKPCQKECDVGINQVTVLELWPKESLPSVDHILIAIDSSAGLVRASIVIDPLGNRTEYRFSDIVFGAKIPAKKFEFSVPEGVSILRTGPAATKK